MFNITFVRDEWSERNEKKKGHYRSRLLKSLHTHLANTHKMLAPFEYYAVSFILFLFLPQSHSRFSIHFSFSLIARFAFGCFFNAHSEYWFASCGFLSSARARTHFKNFNRFFVLCQVQWFFANRCLQFNRLFTAFLSLSLHVCVYVMFITLEFFAPDPYNWHNQIWNDRSRSRLHKRFSLNESRF